VDPQAAVAEAAYKEERRSIMLLQLSTLKQGLLLRNQQLQRDLR
jgi:hypothetical protein